MTSSHSLDIPLYNSRIINNYIKYLKERYNYLDVEEILRYASMAPYEVADENHWFTQRQINLFHEKLIQVSQDKDIAREAGRFSASPEASGVIRQYFLGLVTPAAAYAMVGKAAKNWTRATTFKTKKISSNRVEITVTPRPGIQEQPFQCENRIGSLEAVALLFQSKLPKVDHPECIFDGGKCCRYSFSFEKTLSSHLKQIRNLIAVGFFIILCAAGFINLNFAATILFPTAVVATFLLTLVAGNRELFELRSSLNSLKFSSDRLLEQMEVNYNNAVMTNEIGRAISRQTKSSDVLQNIVQIFKKRLDYDRCMILLADREKKRLLFRAGYGYTEEQLKFLNQTAFNLTKRNSRGIFVVSFKEQKPFLVNDVKEIKKDLTIKSHVFAEKMRSQAFICCPIVADGETLGLLAVDNLKTKRPLVHSDMSLMIGLASVLGISLSNADLLASRERQFQSILHTLAASIDARDPMTAGHSEKVTEYAIGICDELNLPNDYREMIRVAALLHDYGKIGVPDNILKKPGRLTDKEYEIVKTHSDKTRRILNRIHFEGIYRQVPEIAGSHHEKMDGSGYPSGLIGEEIPLGARIIAVADFFEAITARRHYRGPIELKKAFKMVKEESGVTFDSNVVNAFLKYYSKAHAGEPEYRASFL